MGLQLKSREEAVYAFVCSGDLSIQKDGTIWRHRKRVGGAKNRIVVLEKPVRAENVTANGYLQVQVYSSGERTTCPAHRLVWYHVYGPIPAGAMIHHKDKNITNNSPSNLCAMSVVSHNQYHAHAAWNRGRNDIRVAAWHSKTIESKHRNYIKRAEATYAMRNENKMSVRAIASVLNINARTVYQHIADYRKEVMPPCHSEQL